jgi:hypothetical protein
MAPGNDFSTNLLVKAQLSRHFETASQPQGSRLKAFCFVFFVDASNPKQPWS